MKIRAVIFDLGFTLWDVDYGDEPRAYEFLRRRLLKELGGPVPPAKALRDAVAAVFLREGGRWARDNELECRGPTEQVFKEALESLGLDVAGRSRCADGGRDAGAQHPLQRRP